MGTRRRVLLSLFMHNIHILRKRQRAPSRGSDDVAGMHRDTTEAIYPFQSRFALELPSLLPPKIEHEEILCDPDIYAKCQGGEKKVKNLFPAFYFSIFFDFAIFRITGKKRERKGGEKLIRSRMSFSLSKRYRVSNLYTRTYL